MSKFPKIGLALGGGGARGLAHIGVLKVLTQAGIPINLITGSSMGAVVGAAYALSLDIDLVEKLARQLPVKTPQLEQLQNVNRMSRGQKHAVKRIINFIKELYLLNLGATRTSLVDNETVVPLLTEVFNRHTFADLRLPFAAVATDLQSGEEITIRDGSLVQATLASMCVPGIFEPVEWHGRLLVDGSVTSQVPIAAAKELGAEFIIAVNVEAKIFRRHFSRGIDILFQVDEIRGAELNRFKLAQADWVIHPKIGHVNWSQFSKVAECIRRGEEAALAGLPDLEQKLKRYQRSRWKRIFKPFLKSTV